MRKIICVLSIIFFLIFTLPNTIFASYNPFAVPNNIYGIGIINHSDLEDASRLVNSSSGDWGYVTVVITENDRNKEVWQKFMDDCRRLHLIPIIRVATNFDGQNWEIPKIENVDSWVNFFNSLNWVVENRYIIIGNEPNHAKEWGGKIDPEAYAVYLKTFAERLNNSNSDYFVLNAGFDQAATNSKGTMDEKKYIDAMMKNSPDIFTYIDGWNSHSYPNPAFSGPKTGVGRKSIRGYEWELGILKSLGVNKELPIFITETGWVRNNKNEELVAENLRYAFEEVWSKNENIVAVTPFILNYTEEPFYEFSFKNKDGNYFDVFKTIQEIQKLKGSPIQKISGEVLFNFLNPLMFKNSEQRGLSIVRNTGQATWTQSESNVINENGNEIKVSNTKFGQIVPFSTGLVIYTLKTPDSGNMYDIKLGFYVRGQRIGDVFNGKIISF